MTIVDVADWAPLVSALLVYGTALYRWRIATGVLRSIRRMECGGCGYPLRPAWPCPECGGRVGTGDRDVNL